MTDTAGQVPEPLVRPATAADAPEIARIYAHYVTATAVSFEESPPDPAQLVVRMSAEPRLPWLVAEEAGALVGYCYAGQHRSRAAYRWSVDVSVYLRPDCAGRGLGGGLYGELLPLVRDLGYVSAYAGIALPNPASVRLHERAGFRPVGVFRNVGHKLGSWRDVGWWQLALVPPPSAPAEPQPWVPPVPLQ